VVKPIIELLKKPAEGKIAKKEIVISDETGSSLFKERDIREEIRQMAKIIPNR